MHMNFLVSFLILNLIFRRNLKHQASVETVNAALIKRPYLWIRYTTKKCYREMNILRKNVKYLRKQKAQVLHLVDNQGKNISHYPLVAYLLPGSTMKKYFN